MFVEETLDASISQFIQQPNKKVMLITGKFDANFYDKLREQLQQQDPVVNYFDMSQPTDNLFANITTNVSQVFVFTNCKLENYYMQYKLDRWQAKTIIICERSLLHPTLDPSLYFAPVIGGRIQKRLFIKIDMPSQIRKLEQLHGVKLLSSVVTDKKIEKLTYVFDNFLNQKLMTKDSVMMQMLADRVQEDKNFKDFLFKLVFSSRDDEQMQISSANAITALTRARTSFSGMDLQKINILWADLSYGIFDSTNFSGANLMGVNFAGAWLKHADFSHCIMHEVKFGEIPALEHEQMIRTIKYSPDGKWIAITIAPNEKLEQRLYIWNAATSELAHCFTLITKNFNLINNHIVFSSDARIVAMSNTDGSIYVWDILTGKLQQILLDHTKEVSYMNFYLDNRMFVSSAEDSTAILWYLNENNHYQLHVRLTNVAAIVCHVSKNILASCSTQGIVMLHDATTGTIIHLYHEDFLVVQLVFDSQGGMLAGVNAEGLIYIWDIERKILLNVLPEKGFKVCIEFSPDGKLLTSFCKEHVNFWDPIAGYLKKTFMAPSCYAFSSRNNMIAIVINTEVQLIELENFQIVAFYRDVGYPFSIAFSPNGAIVAIEKNSGMVHLWDTTAITITERPLSQGHKDEVTCLALSPKYHCIATSGGFIDPSIRLWDEETGQIKYLLRAHSSHINALAFSPNNKLLAAGGYDKQMSIWEITTGKLQSTLVLQSYVNCLAFSPNEEIVVCGNEDATFDILELNSNESIPIIVHEGEINCIVFSADGNTLVTGSGDGTVGVFNMPLLPTPRGVRLLGHSEAVRCVAVTYDGNIIISGAEDGKICLWYRIANSFLKQILHGHTGVVFDLAINTRSNVLISGSEDKNVILWDINSGQQKFVCCGHTKQVRCVAQSKDNKVFASGGDDRTARIWRIEDGALVAILEHSDDINVLIFSDKNDLYTGSEDHTVRCWRLEKNQWVLRWSSHFNQNFSKCNISDVTGLSSANRRLLQQANDEFELQNVKAPHMGLRIKITADSNDNNDAILQRATALSLEDKTSLSALHAPVTINLNNIYTFLKKLSIRTSHNIQLSNKFQLAKEGLSISISDFLQQQAQKVLLIVGEITADLCHTVVQLIKKEKQSVYFFDMSQPADVENMIANISRTQPHVFIFANVGLKNYYTKYQLDCWQAKVIFFCDKSLLHPTLDPSLYFAPIKDNRLQKSLLSKLELLTAASQTEALSTITIEKRIELCNHLLNHKLISKDLLLIEMLAERVLADDAFKELFFQLILASRDNELFHVAAVNAITVLMHAHVSCSGMDLQKINIRGADLSYGIFDSTNFSGANLTNVRFVGAWLNHADLSHCIMQDVEFGEKPPLEHEQMIRAIKYSPDGKWIAASIVPNENFEQKVYLWNAENSKLMYCLVPITKNFHNSFNFIAFNADSTILAMSNADGSVYLWNVLTGQLKQILLAHTMELSYIAFYLAGKMLITCSKDTTAALWQCNENQQYQIKVHIEDVLSIACCIGENILVSLSSQGTILLHDGFTGMATQIVCNNIPSIQHLTFDSRGKLLAAVNDKGLINILDITHKKLLHVLQDEAFKGEYNNSYTEFSPDCKFIICSYLNYLNLWDPVTGLLIKKFMSELHFLNSGFAFRPDGSTLAIIINDEVQLVDLESFQSQAFFREVNSFRHIAFSPDGQTLAVEKSCGMVHLWNTTVSNFPLHSFRHRPQGHKDKVSCLVLSPNQLYVASAGDFIDSSVRLWEVETGRLLHTLQSYNWFIKTLNFNATSQLLFVGDVDSITVWDVITGKLLSSLKLQDSFNCLAINPSGEILICGNSDASIHVHDMINVKHKKIMVHNDEVNCAIFSKDGSTLVTGSNDTTICVFRLSRSVTTHEARLQKHTKGVMCLAITNDGNIIASSSEDGMICLWNRNTYGLLQVLIGHAGAVFVLAISASADILVSAGTEDNIIFIWDIKTGQKKLMLPGHVDLVTSIAISNNGNIIASSSADSTVMVWEAKSGELLSVLECNDSVNTVIFNNNDHIYTGSDDHTVRCWRKEKNRWFLQWTSQVNPNFNKCNISGAIGLSQSNHQFLQQLYNEYEMRRKKEADVVFRIKDSGNDNSAEDAMIQESLAMSLEENISQDKLIVPRTISLNQAYKVLQKFTMFNNSSLSVSSRAVKNPPSVVEDEDDAALQEAIALSLNKTSANA